jgi:hypothetical protein
MRARRECHWRARRPLDVEEGHDAGDGTEDPFPHELHTLVDVDDHHGLEEVARVADPASTGHHTPTAATPPSTQTAFASASRMLAARPLTIEVLPPNAIAASARVSSNSCRIISTDGIGLCSSTSRTAQSLAKHGLDGT